MYARKPVPSLRSDPLASLLKIRTVTPGSQNSAHAPVRHSGISLAPSPFVSIRVNSWFSFHAWKT
jgi:hypothetical protein